MIASAVASSSPLLTKKCTDADPDDRRSKRIALTTRGEQAAYTIRDAVRDIERDWEKQLGREPFARLRNLLIELNQLM